MSFQPQVRKSNRERLRQRDFVLFVDQVYLNSGAQFFGSFPLDGLKESSKYASIRTLVVTALSCDQ